MSEWYQLETDQVIENLQTDPQDGLSDEEARNRLEKYGPNELVEKGGRSPWLILWDQMKEVMVVILLVAAIVSSLSSMINSTATIFSMDIYKPFINPKVSDHCPIYIDIELT